MSNLDFEKIITIIAMIVVAIGVAAIVIGFMVGMYLIGGFFGLGFLLFALAFIASAAWLCEDWN